MINYVEKGYGLHEFLNHQGYTIQELDGGWIGLPPGNDAVINALIAAYQPPPTLRTIPLADFMLRFPADVPGRAYALMPHNPRLAVSWQMLFTQANIDLDHELLVRELNYLTTLEDGQGPLLSAADRAALTA